MEKIILVGGGGHCRSCIDVIEQQGKFRVEGIVDLPGKLGTEMMGYKFIGTDDDLERLAREYPYFLITMGMIRVNHSRRDLYNRIRKAGGVFPLIISPNTYISKHAAIGEGTVLMHGVIVNAGAVIGVNCIVNSHALIEHDAHVNDHCHIATAAVINGGVKVGANTFIGSGAITKQNVVIPAESFVAANSIFS